MALPHSSYATAVTAGMLLAVMVAMGTAASGPFRRVGIGIYVLNVGEIDIAGGSVYLDYLLTLKELQQPFQSYESAISVGLQPGRVCSNTDSPGWVDWNGTASDITVVNLQRVGEIRALDFSGQFRVLGQHFFRTNLKAWPFETQTLELIIELSRQFQGDIFDVVFCHIHEYSGLSSSIRFPGETALSLTTSHLCVERCWPPFTQPDATCLGQNQITAECRCNPAPYITFNFTNHFSCRCQGGKKIASRYYGLIMFNRPEGIAFMKVMLPPFFILLVIMVTYWLKPESDEARFSMCAATLLSAIFFHVAIRSELPTTSELTKADSVMITVYCVNSLAWTTTLVLSVLYRNSIPTFKKYTRTVFYFTRIFGPLMSGLVFAIVAGSGESYWWAWFLSVVFGTLLSAFGYYTQVHLHQRVGEWSEKREQKLKEAAGAASPPSPPCTETTRSSANYQVFVGNNPQNEHTEKGPETSSPL